MAKHRVIERVFTCPDCGTIMTAYKSESKNTSKGHIKTMWCYRCKEVKDFVQLPKFYCR